MRGRDYWRPSTWPRTRGREFESLRARQFQQRAGANRFTIEASKVPKRSRPVSMCIGPPLAIQINASPQVSTADSPNDGRYLARRACEIEIQKGTVAWDA